MHTHDTQIIDLNWSHRSLQDLAVAIEQGEPANLADLAAELAAVLEVSAELVGELDLEIAEVREEIAVIDADRAGRELVAADKPSMSRRMLPWQVRRTALAWLWRPYTADPEGLGALREALDAAAMAAHREACRAHAAVAISPLLQRRLVRLAERAFADLRSHRRTLERARRCQHNLETVRRALSGEVIDRRPRPLVRRAPDPLRAAARAVVPYEVREAALNWLWEPHLAAA